MKTNSFLPNSCAETYIRKSCDHGYFETRWIEEIDAHGLFYARNSGDFADKQILLATHHNGYSCDTLAKRMVSGNVIKSLDQAKYIIDCGGTCKDLGSIQAIAEGNF